MNFLWSEAEAAYRAAMKAALALGARTFELQAARGLSKLRRSTCRAADAHAALRDALEDFAPTQNLPALSEAQALDAELAKADDSAQAGAARQRRLDLQLAYGSAAHLGTGQCAAPEALAAYEQAFNLTRGDPLAWISALYRAWA